METKKKNILSGSIARYMESGLPILTCKYLLDSAGGDISLVEKCLDDWQKEGCIVWRKLLNAMEPSEEVVCFGKFPEGGSFWPPRLTFDKTDKVSIVDLWGDGRFVADYPDKQLDFLRKYLPQMRVIDRRDPTNQT